METRNLLSTPRRAMGMATTTAFAATATLVMAPVPAASANDTAWPEVVGQMPDEAQIILFTRSINEVNSGYDQFMQAIDMAQMAFIPNPIGGLQMMGINTEAMNLEGSIGMAVMKDSWEADIPPVLMFVPTSDFGAWTASLGAQPVEGSELMQFTPHEGGGGGGGETWYLRSNGAYAVMGLDQQLVTDHEAGSGQSGKWSSLIGTLGNGVAERCDVVAAVDFDGLAPILKEAMNEGFGEMENNMGAMPPGAMGGGMNPDQIMMMMRAYQDIAAATIDDLRGACVGMRMDGDGAAFDFSLQFKDESQMASMFPGTESPRNLLKQFDDAPYLMAMSMDMKGCNFSEWMKMFMEKMPNDMMGMGNPMQMPGMDMMEKVDGTAMVLYPSPAGIMGGLFNSAVAMYTGDPATIRKGLGDSFTEMNGMEAGGVTYTTEWAGEAQEIAGVTVDTYSMSMQFPPDMMMQGQQMMNMMYGPMGMRGFIAPVEGGVVLTMSRNSTLLERTINAAKATNGLGATPTMASVNEMLSPEPSGLVYVGVGTIMEQVGPMLMMFMPGVQMDPEMLAKMPPLAMSMSSRDGGVQGTMAVPAPLVRSVMQIVQKIQEAQMMNDGNMGGDEDEPDIF